VWHRMLRTARVAVAVAVAIDLLAAGNIATATGVAIGDAVVSDVEPACSRWTLEGLRLGMSIVQALKVHPNATRDTGYDGSGVGRVVYRWHPAANPRLLHGFMLDGNYSESEIISIGIALDTQGEDIAKLRDLLIKKWGPPIKSSTLPPPVESLRVDKWMDPDCRVAIHLSRTWEDAAAVTDPDIWYLTLRPMADMKGLSDVGQILVAGKHGVSNPVLIRESYVTPRFPQVALKAKIQARVVLQAVIHKDGSVGDVRVVSPPEKFGFNEAAIAAVKQWRYHPGRDNGKPVDVYFTVVVDFLLK